MVHLTADQFLEEGLLLVGYPIARQNLAKKSTNLSRFKSAYAQAPNVCTAIFNDFQSTAIIEARIE